jgi:hypothetical protein
MLKDVLKALLSDKEREIPFETQLQTLKDAGISPNADVTEEVIASELEKMGFSLKDTETDPSLLLVVLGSSREVSEDEVECDSVEYDSSECESYKSNSNDVLFFDTTCVQESGIYHEVLESLITMANGNLDLKNIEEFLDLDKFDAHISFVFKEKDYTLEIGVVEDNFDMTLLTKLNNILDSENCEKLFCIQCDEETVIIIFSDKDTVKNLNRNLDLGFELA